MFMNEDEIADVMVRYAEHPILGPATRTLAKVCVAANQNSDGWAYWPKPSRAASKLMELIRRDGTAQYRFDFEREDVTLAELKRAYAPLKAFRTRTGIDFEIVEPGVPTRADVERERAFEAACSDVETV